MWRFVSNTILRNRFFFIGFIVILSILFAYSAFTKLKLENKYGIVLPKDSKTSKDYASFKSKFGEDGNTLVFAIQTDSLYTKERLLKWKELGDSILRYKGVESRQSEVTLFNLINNREENKFDLRMIFSDTDFKEKSVDSLRDEIRGNPTYNNLLFNDSTNVSLMMIKIDEVYLSDSLKSKLLPNIEALAKTYESYFGEIRFAGLPHLRVIIGSRIQKEMYFFIALSMIVTSLLLYLFFRSLKVVFISNIVVSIAVVWALGSIGLMGFRLSILMALIPPLVIVIGIPNCVFLMTKYHQEIKEHGNKIKALSRVIQKIGTATLMTNFTTALGFSTFIFTNSEKLMEFGIAASLNIMFVYFLSITLLPIFSSFASIPRERHLKHLDRTLAKGMINLITHFSVFKRKWVYVFTIIILFFSFWGISRIKTTGNITGDLPDKDPIKKDLLFIEKHFGGSIPFEIMIDAKKQSRLFKRSTLFQIDSIQNFLEADSLFSRTISIVDFVKSINMSYYGNDKNMYKIFSKRDRKRLKKYIDGYNLNNPSNNGYSMNDLVDTTNNIIRIRCQLKDIGSYEVVAMVKRIKKDINQILNPNRSIYEKYYDKIDAGNYSYVDSIIQNHPEIYLSLIHNISGDNKELESKFDTDDQLIKSYYKKSNFKKHLRASINDEYFEPTFTGTSVVAAQGTRYLVKNLLTSLFFAIVSIAILMAILFRSWRMVLISMLPNLIPLFITGGIMGWLSIPLKPSTLLVFSIAFGISVDDTIHYLAKYRLELKQNKWDMKQCVINAIKEAGIGMFYTSIVLYCGFSVFLFSQFGGTQALGLLVSITLLIAMLTNLILLPSLLLTLDSRIAMKAFEEPFFDAYSSENEIDWSELKFISNDDEDNNQKTIED